MDWLLDHLRLIFIVGGTIAWWLNQRRQAKETESTPPREATFEDPELAERTRRIREEIQRKIQQRNQGALPSAQPESSSAEPPPIAPAPRALAQPGARTETRREVERRAQVLEEQAAWAERLQEAQLMKLASARRSEFETTTSDPAQLGRQERYASLLGELRDPVALRRAFVMREILGPPVALRR